MENEPACSLFRNNLLRMCITNPSLVEANKYSVNWITFSLHRYSETPALLKTELHNADLLEDLIIERTLSPAPHSGARESM